MAFDRRYTPDEKDAVVSAYIDRGIRPASRICEMAAAGQLTTARGDRLPPFHFHEATLRAYVKVENRKRQGRAASPLLTMPHRDAVEETRRRFLAVIDVMLRDVEAKVAKNPDKGDIKRIRDLAGLARDIAAMPDRKEPNPKAPGSKAGGERLPDAKDTELKRSILADLQRGDDKGPAVAGPDDRLNGGLEGQLAGDDVRRRLEQALGVPVPGS